MIRTAMKFVGMIKKTATKWQSGKNDQPGGRIMQVTIEVEGLEADRVARELLQFGAEENLNVIMASKQLDAIRDMKGADNA